MQPSSIYKPPTAPEIHQVPLGSYNQPPSAPSEPESAKLPSSTSDLPIPVIKVLSVKGVEYAMMTITLWIAAATLAWVVLNFINGSASYNYLVVPISALLVCVPVFGVFFVRLRSAELANTALRLDPSKRRWSQITQLLAFVVCIVNLIVFVYSVMQSFSGGDKNGYSVGKAALNMTVILIIAGGILTYYWFDEHRLIKN